MGGGKKKGKESKGGQTMKEDRPRYQNATRRNAKHYVLIAKKGRERITLSNATDPNMDPSHGHCQMARCDWASRT